LKGLKELTTLNRRCNMASADIIAGQARKAGYTTKMLAKQCRIPVSTFFYKLKEERFTVSELRRIAAVIGLSKEDLWEIIRGE
jgi:predicted transcriptional regulator